MSQRGLAQRAHHVVVDAFGREAEFVFHGLHDNGALYRAHDGIRLLAAELVEQQACCRLACTQPLAPAGVALGCHGLAHHIETEQQADRLHGDEGCQHRFLEFMYRLPQGAERCLILRTGGGHLQHQVLRREQRRA